MQEYWRVTEEKQRECTYKGKHAKVCVTSLKTEPAFTSRARIQPLRVTADWKQFTPPCILSLYIIVNDLYWGVFFPFQVFAQNSLWSPLLRASYWLWCPNKGTGGKCIYTALTLLVTSSAPSAASAVSMWHVCVFTAEPTSSDLGILSAGFCFRWNVVTTSEPCTESTTPLCMCVAQMLSAPPVIIW